MNTNPSKVLTVATDGQGLYEFTKQVESFVAAARLDCAVCHLFVKHTSCSLLIQENADPSAKRDLEHWLNRLVPEKDPLYTHVFEGADDMPAHIKAALTASCLTIPILNGRLALGTWQGLFLWEHRHAVQQRQIVLHLSL